MQVQGIGFKLRALPDAAAALEALTAERRATIEAAFRAIDADGSGDIDSEELHGAVKVMELNLRPEEVQDLIQAVDRDGSGSIDLAEVRPARPAAPGGVPGFLLWFWMQGPTRTVTLFLRPRNAARGPYTFRLFRNSGPRRAELCRLAGR